MPTVSQVPSPAEIATLRRACLVALGTVMPQLSPSELEHAVQADDRGVVITVPGLQIQIVADTYDTYDRNLVPQDSARAWGVLMPGDDGPLIMARSVQLAARAAVLWIARIRIDEALLDVIEDSTACAAAKEA